MNGGFEIKKTIKKNSLAKNAKVSKFIHEQIFVSFEELHEN